MGGVLIRGEHVDYYVQMDSVIVDQDIEEKVALNLVDIID